MNQVKKGDLFVSPDGDRVYDGYQPVHEAEGARGPLSSIEDALERARVLLDRGLRSRVTIWLMDGVYRQKAPICIGPGQDGAITLAAYPGSAPVISGAVPMTGWRKGVLPDGREAWVADVQDHLDQYGEFHSVFVNGKCAARPRWPRSGKLRIQGNSQGEIPEDMRASGGRIFVRTEDLDGVDTLEGAEMIVHHFWVEERIPVREFDEKTGEIRFERMPVFRLTRSFESEWAEYVLENVFEGISPGEWYLEKAAGRLWYMPHPEQRMDRMSIEIPVCEQLLRVRGIPEEGTYVRGLEFKGITFAFTGWHQPEEPGRYDPYGSRDASAFRDPVNMEVLQEMRKDRAGALKGTALSQSDRSLPGVLHFFGAEHCRLEGCTIKETGYHGVEFAPGCRGIKVEGCHLHDLGGGGVYIWGDSSPVKGREETRQIRVTDCHIHSVGHIFTAGCGVLVAHANRVTIAHNEIHDICYSGLSLGWCWQFEDTQGQENLIEYNHIYDVGVRERGGLSDMGLIYTLGIQPGTVIRRNWLHGVRAADYGATGIYLDGKSCGMVIEENVVHDCQHQAVHLNGGQANTFRNNLLFAGEDAVLKVDLTHNENYTEYPNFPNRFEGNVLVSGGQPMIHDRVHYMRVGKILAARNAYHDRSCEPVIYRLEPYDCAPEDVSSYSLKTWQEKGAGPGSILLESSPAAVWDTPPVFQPEEKLGSMGIQSVDLSEVGPRPEALRCEMPNAHMESYAGIRLP